MPITPVEILMVNLVTSVLLSIGLAFEAPEPDIMRPPRRPDASLLSPLFVRRIVLVSVLMRAGTFGLFLAVTRAGGSVEDGRTAAVDALVLFECVHLLNTQSILRPAFPSAGGRSPLIRLGMLAVPASMPSPPTCRSRSASSRPRPSGLRSGPPSSPSPRWSSWRSRSRRR